MKHNKTALIILGGCLETIDLTLQNFDLIIAVDKGANYAYTLDLMPNLLIGDLDSISPEILEYYRNLGVPVEVYDQEKDFIDSEMAYLVAKKRGFNRLFILAALGGRQDHQMANILTAASFMSDFDQITLWGEKECFLLSRGSYEVHEKDGNLVSLLALSKQVEGVVTEGLVYPLKNETLYFGSGRGMSNLICEKQAKISYQTGELLLIQTRL
ncbi:MAG: thiamine diphosphokinase [Bacillota bacterium]|jgi:thiamine pyrophosphokinase